jgi:hypothetical protein
MNRVTEQASSSGAMQRERISQSLTDESRGHVHIWEGLGISMPNIPTEDEIRGVHPATGNSSYRDADFQRHRSTHREDCDDCMDEMILPPINNIMSRTNESSLDNDHRVPSVDSFAPTYPNRDTIPSSPPLALSDIFLPHLAMSNVSLEHDMGNCDSECVTVEGRLADLSDNDECLDDNSDADEGGIVILDESTEEEYEEAMRESSWESQRASPRVQFPSPNTSENLREARMGIPQASIYENDPIVLEAAARVNETSSAAHSSFDNQSIDFEQLLREADDRSVTQLEDDYRDEGEISEPRQQSQLPATLASQSHVPVRATRIRHDKYLVEISMLRSNDTTDLTSDIREVIDFMANIELLHLWFDAIPAVFDATTKDGGSGSGNGAPSNQSSSSSPLNSMDGTDFAANYDTNRQYDGQWVEISTPPLKIPSDSRISGCLRAFRVSLRSILGFPQRIRSMLFVERSCGRMGMTLGPFPDGFLCSSGTMAYHTFNVRISNDEEIGDAASNNGRCIVISDEVRLQIGGADDDFVGRTRRTSCCICSLFHFVFGILKWAMFYRCYQPDLASYMQQSCSSLERLRTLIERGGESAAYHGCQESVTDDDEWRGRDANDTLGRPLLG